MDRRMHLRKPRWQGRPETPDLAISVLFVANFGPETGYAWNTILRVFSGIAGRLREDGILCAVAYPPTSAAGGRRSGPSGLEPIEVDYRRARRALPELIRFLRLLRTRRVRLIYLTDAPTWSPLYVLFRLAGVREIIVHDRTSGERHPTVPRRLKVWLHRMPWITADAFIGVSDFVVDRLIRSNGTPAERTYRVYNGIDLRRFEHLERGALRDALGLSPDVPIVFFSGRAHPAKGIDLLVDSAVVLRARGFKDVTFVCCGDGPALPALKERAERQGLTRFHFLGRRDDVERLLADATVAVVPARWAEAFGLTVVEAMAAGVPLVATRRGAIPELVRDGESGVLVSPDSANSLAAGLERLLRDPELRGRIGATARREAHERFGIGRTIDELYAVVRARLVKADQLAHRESDELRDHSPAAYSA